jgi:hypothetical protein
MTLLNGINSAGSALTCGCWSKTSKPVELAELGGVQPAVARVRDRLTRRGRPPKRRDACSIPPDQPPGCGAGGGHGEVWAARVEDLRAEHPGVRRGASGSATALDPALARLRHALEALADAATELTEP